MLFPAALAARGEALGKEFVASLTMGAGQFCTNPGLVLAIDGPDLDAFIASAATAMTDASSPKKFSRKSTPAAASQASRPANRTARRSARAAISV